MTPEQLDDIESRQKAASDHIDDLCNARKIWTMHIPADPERDSDLVISRSLADIPALVAEVRRLNTVLAAVREMHTYYLGMCTECGAERDPCPTVAALDAKETT